MIEVEKTSTHIWYECIPYCPLNELTENKLQQMYTRDVATK